ncbi:DUF262 domain-containing protein [Agrococcus jejuensis]|uniref:Uncharacterized conserved protein, contains ParB-like and HNH nuclease domains n=1 Tax=Agrococcus jejuensis TaxID=399736 RepID=A0A1G8AQY0_9MICO|nr:DUF262 domain-containing protein [Agrococcus jejuensis]SDH23293.1 Uncharacterized conserved protein, contains ParB-like and HNH nuclease domains [Agrococcus jejuensis]
MAHKDATTVAETLRRIQRGDLILPAIQREYVWKPSQVVKLFDSMMRGYPIGTFLSWKVEPSTAKSFKFYGFMREYSAYDNRHNQLLDVDPSRPVTAVLDGQQRLTSLNIGLRGTYAYKNKGGWASKEWSYPTRHLYLNLLGYAPENDAGLRYHLAFLTKEQVAAAEDDAEHRWLRVSDVFEAAEPAAWFKLAQQYGVGNDEIAVEILGNLWAAVHSTASLQFYEESDQDIERVLDIFIRVNSGGTVLSYSDLLLSIATAQWKTRDARAAVHGLVDQLNATGAGFDFAKDTVLKAGLVLTDIRDFGFKVKNFRTENMELLDAQWDSISESLRVAAGLLWDFGLSDATLTADSVLIPIAYYLQHRGLGNEYRLAEKHRDDRGALRTWVLRSLIARGVWGSGLDTLLREMREVIRVHGTGAFPDAALDAALARQGKSLEVTESLVDDLLSLRFGGPRTFATLAILFDHVDTRSVHHVDHVFPASLLSRKAVITALSQNGGPSPDREHVDTLLSLRDSLANLELLPGAENVDKSDQDPASWLDNAYPTHDARSAFLDRNALPDPLPTDVSEFEAFIERRRTLLAQRIALRLGGLGGVPAVGTDSDAGIDDIDTDLGVADDGSEALS